VVTYEQIELAEIPNRISFSSQKQEDEGKRRYSASLAPEQHMGNLYELICFLFGLNTEGI